jgi:hypothetical protein
MGMPHNSMAENVFIVSAGTYFYHRNLDKVLHREKLIGMKSA